MIRIRTAFVYLLLFAAATGAFGQALSPGNLLSLPGGTNNYVINTNFQGFPTQGATVEMWMKTSAANPAGLLSYATTNSDNAMLIYNPARLEVWINGAATVVNTNALTNGAWHHIAVAWTNAGPTTVYVDGVQTFSGNIGIGQTLVNFGSLVLGQDQDVYGGGFNDGQAYNGQIDELRIWDRVRSAAEIRTNRHQSLSNSVPGLVAYYRFDEVANPFLTSHGSSAGTANILTRYINGTPITSTVPFLPGIAAYNAYSVTPTSAVLRATVYPNNVPTGARFEWGTTDVPLANTNHFDLGSGSGPTASVVTLSNLTYGTTYYYRFVLTNSLATNILAKRWFTAGIFTVTNLSDSGLGSLRDSVESAGDGSRIVFGTIGTIPLVNGPLNVTGDITIAGPGIQNLLINGQNASRLFQISAGRTLLIHDLTMTNGHAPDGYSTLFGGTVGGENGGAINNAGVLTLRNCVIANCRAGAGVSGGLSSGPGGSGGALNNTGSTVIENCAFTGNFAGGGAGGFGSTSPGGYGGAIVNSGSILILRSSFSGNAAGNGGSTSFGGGGAGGPGSALANSGDVTLALCTISGNRSGFGGTGGGPGGGTPGTPGFGSIYNFGSGTMTIEASTIVSNTVRGSVYNASSGELIVRSTISAGNEAGDLGGTIRSEGYNLIGFFTNAAGLANGVNFDKVGTLAAPIDPQLHPLGSAGGITLVHTFGTNSPAFDAGDDLLASLGTDQRGADRLMYNHVDIGAVEYNYNPGRFVTTLGATLTFDPNAGGTKIVLSGAAMPGAKPSTVYFDIGSTAAYGGRSTASALAAGINPVPMTEVLNAGDGYTIHYRAVLSNAVEVLYGQDQVVSTPFRGLPGDTNRDGVLSEGEMQTVLTNYFQTDLWLKMTNTAGLGTTNVSFALTTNLLPVFNVEVSTNLATWDLVGPALPRYDFVDTNAVDDMRYYRLRTP